MPGSHYGDRYASHTMVTDMQVLDLGGYDAILGYDWLKLHSPMTCHWDTLCSSNTRASL